MYSCCPALHHLSGVMGRGEVMSAAQNETSCCVIVRAASNQQLECKQQQLSLSTKKQQYVEACVVDLNAVSCAQAEWLLLAFRLSCCCLQAFCVQRVEMQTLGHVLLAGRVRTTCASLLCTGSHPVTQALQCLYFSDENAVFACAIVRSQRRAMLSTATAKACEV